MHSKLDEEIEPPKIKAKSTFSARKSYYVKKKEQHVTKIRIPDFLSIAPKEPGIPKSEKIPARKFKIINSEKTNDSNSNSSFKKTDRIPNLENLFNFQILPLAFFDDTNLEKVDLNKLNFLIKSGEVITGYSLLHEDDFNDMEWRYVLVLGMSPDKSTILVEFVDNDIRKFVGRLNCRFSFEDTGEFEARRKKAIDYRDRFMRKQRFYAYLDSTLDPKDSFQKAEELIKIERKIKPSLLTKKDYVIKIFREICLLDVSSRYISEYIFSLSKDLKKAEEYFLNNFPRPKDFEGERFEHKQKEIDFKINIIKIANILETESEALKKETFKQKMEVKVLAKSVSIVSYLELNYNFDNIIDFCKDINIKISQSTSQKFGSIIRETVSRIAKFEKIDLYFAKYLDEMIIQSISEATNEMIYKILCSFKGRKLRFIKNISHIQNFELQNDINAVKRMEQFVADCWIDAKVPTISSLFSRELSFFKPNEDLISDKLREFKSFISEDIYGQYSKANEIINNFYLRYRSPMEYTFSLEHSKTLSHIDVERATCMIGMETSFTPPSEILNGQTFEELLSYDKEIEQKLSELNRIETVVHFPILKLSFHRLVSQTRFDLMQIRKQIHLMLFEHGVSLTIQVVSQFHMIKNAVIVVVSCLDDYIVLKHNFEKAPEAIEKQRQKIHTIEKALNVLESASSPFSLKLRAKLFEAKLKMHVFESSFELRWNELHAAREILKRDYDDREHRLLLVIQGLELELSLMAQQSFTDEVKAAARESVTLSHKFDSAVLEFNEISRGDRYLYRQTFDPSNLNMLNKTAKQLEMLWTTIARFTEENERIAGSPIGFIDTKQIGALIVKWKAQIGEVISKTEGIPIPHNVARKTMESILLFNEYIPMINVFTSTALRNRHWNEINGLFSKQASIDYSVTLYYLIDIDVLTRKKEILEIYEIALKEFEIETELDKLMSQWNQWTFTVKRNRLKEFTDSALGILKHHKRVLNTLSSSEYSKPFDKKIKDHMKEIVDMRNLMKILVKLNDVYNYQKDFMKADDTVTHNPRFAAAFEKLRRMFKGGLSQLVSCFNISLLPSYFKDICEELIDLREQIYPYLEERRKEYYRLSFLSDSELFEIIASSKSEEKISQKIHLIIPAAKSLVFEKRQIVGLVAKDDSLISFHPINFTVDNIPKLFESIVTKTSESLKRMILEFSSKSWNFLLSRVNSVPFQVIFVAMNIKLTTVFNTSARLRSAEDLQKFVDEYRSLKVRFAEEIIERQKSDSVSELFGYFESILKEMNDINLWNVKVSLDSNYKRSPLGPNKGRLLGSMSSIFFKTSKPPKQKHVLDSPLLLSPIAPSDSSFMEEDIEQDTDYSLTEIAQKFKTGGKLFKNNSMNILPIIKDLEVPTPSKPKQPRFIRFFVEDGSIIIKLGKMNGVYGYELKADSFYSHTMPSYSNISLLLEGVSYNQACCFPQNSFCVNNFISQVSNICGVLLFSVHINHQYSRMKYRQYIAPLKKEIVWIHFEDFDFLDPVKQHEAVLLALGSHNHKYANRGYFFASGEKIKTVHFTNLRPVYLEIEETSPALAVVGSDIEYKTNIINKYAFERSKKLIEIYQYSDLISENIENAVVWIHKALEACDLSIYESKPYFMTFDGTRIFFNSECEFIFDVFLKSDLEVKATILNDQSRYRRFHSLEEVFPIDYVEFFELQASKLGAAEADPAQLTGALASSFYPAEHERVLRVNWFNPSGIDISKIMLDCIEAHSSIFIVCENSFNLMAFLINFLRDKLPKKRFVFDPSNLSSKKICVVSEKREIEYLTNNTYIVTTSHVSNISFEIGHRFSFIPGCCISFDRPEPASDLQGALANTGSVMFSLIAGIGPNQIKIQNSYLIDKESDQEFVLKKAISENVGSVHHFFIIISHPFFELTNLIEFQLKMPNIAPFDFVEVLSRSHFIFVTPLSLLELKTFDNNFASKFQYVHEVPKVRVESPYVSNFSFATELASKVYTGRAFITILDSIKKYTNDFRYKYIQIVEKDLEKVRNFLGLHSSLINYGEKVTKDIHQIEEQISISCEIIKQKEAELQSARTNHQCALQNLQENLEEFTPTMEEEIAKVEDLKKQIENLVPIVESSHDFIANFDIQSVQMIRALKTPTPSILPIFECYSIIFDVSPDVKINGNLKFYDYFGPMQKVIQNSSFTNNLASFADIRLQPAIVQKVSKVIEKCKEQLQRAGKVNKDFANTVRWMKELIRLNNTRDVFEPICVERVERENQIEEFKNFFKQLEANVDMAFEELRIANINLEEAKQAKERLLCEKEKAISMLSKVKEMTETISLGVKRWKPKEEELVFNLENANDISYQRSLAVHCLAAMPQSSHEFQRSLLSAKFKRLPELMPQFEGPVFRKLRALGVLRSAALAEKFAAVLDPIRTPLIFDPHSLCVHSLRVIFPHLIFAAPKDFGRYNEGQQIVAVVDDPREVLAFVGRNIKAFVVTSKRLDQIPIEVLANVVYIDFGDMDYASVLHGQFIVKRLRSEFSRLEEREGRRDCSEAELERATMAIADAFESDEERFFGTDLWANLRQTFADIVVQVSYEEMGVRRSEEAIEVGDFEESESALASSLLKAIAPMLRTETSAIFPLILSLSISNENEDLFEAVVSAMRPAFEHRYESIDAGFNIHFKDPRLDIHTSKPFSFDGSLISAEVPVVIRSDPSHDPTPLLLRHKPSMIASLSEKMPSEVYRFSGWLIIRYPDSLPNGMTLLSSYLMELMTKHQFPLDFRLIIIVSRETIISNSISQISIVWRWPLLIPPSQYSDFIISSFGISDKRKIDRVKTVASQFGPLARFGRPTAVVDIISNDFVRLSRIGKNRALPDFSSIPEDSLWLSQYSEGRREQLGRFPRLSNIIEISLEDNGGVQTDCLFAANAVIEGGEFVEGASPFPFHCGTVYLRSLSESEVIGESLCPVYGNDPLQVIARARVKSSNSVIFVVDEML